LDFNIKIHLFGYYEKLDVAIEALKKLHGNFWKNKK